MPEGNKIDSFMEYYLKESPQLINNIEFIYDNKVENIEQAQQLVKNHPEDKVDTFSYNNIECGVYLYEKRRNEWFYVLVSENSPVVLGVIRFEKKDDAIYTSGLWNSFMMQGLVFAFFTHYVIMRYHTVISDAITTQHGMKFWLKMANWALQNKKETGIFDASKNTFRDITDIKIIEQSFSKLLDSQNERVYVSQGR